MFFLFLIVVLILILGYLYYTGFFSEKKTSATQAVKKKPVDNKNVEKEPDSEPDL